MLVRQCGRPGHRALTCLRHRPRAPRHGNPLYGGSPCTDNSSSTWITDEVLRRAFLSFTRRFSQSSRTCERLQTELRRERRQEEEPGSESSPPTSGVSAHGWGDIPPTFRWSLSRYKDRMPTLDGLSVFYP